MIARGLVLAACLLAASLPWKPAASALYTFVQGGFPGGLTTTVRLMGSDLDGDGFLASADDEVTRISLTFAPLATRFPSGIDTIDHAPPPGGEPPGSPVTFLLRYRADGGPLGDEADEFLTYSAGILISYSLDGGLDSCVAGVTCGLWAIIDALNGATAPDFFGSAEILRPLPVVVPEPGAVALLTTALLGLAGLARPVHGAARG